MAREDEHPDVLMAQSAFHISKNIERIAASLERVEQYLHKITAPPIHFNGRMETIWGKGPDKT